MKKLFYVLLAVSLNAWVYPALAYSFDTGATYQVCFTPGQNCTGEMVNAINKARKTIRVQAYSFTSAPIAKALVLAKSRGIDVNVILDKSQLKERYTSATYLYNQSIRVYIDYRPAIAHNKIMIIDASTTITGSFNFTKVAQQRNAENVLIIHDQELAKIYLKNWNKRLSFSKSYSKKG